MIPKYFQIDFILAKMKMFEMKFQIWFGIGYVTKGSLKVFNLKNWNLLIECKLNQNPYQLHSRKTFKKISKTCMKLQPVYSFY